MPRCNSISFKQELVSCMLHMKGFLIFCDVYLAFLESPVSVHSQRELFLVSENLKKVFTIESFAVSQERDDFLFFFFINFERVW